MHLAKNELNVWASHTFKNDGKRGTFEEDLQRCIVTIVIQETCPSNMLGTHDADFLRAIAFGSIRSSDLLK